MENDALNFVKKNTENGICTITFSNPPHNALTSAMLSDLAVAIETSGNEVEAKVIVLQSAGERAFCAGASFDEMKTIQNEADGIVFFSGFGKVIWAMRSVPKFVICRVQGKAVGGGVGLAAAADYCVASTFASVRLSELHIGFGPFVISPALERKMGTSAFSQMTINASAFFSPHWAMQKGLFAEVHEPEKLDEAVQNLAQTLAQYNPEAMRQLKEIFWHNTTHWQQLMAERAKMSASLVLNNAIGKNQ